jgi:hypothetical protein
MALASGSASFISEDPETGSCRAWEGAVLTSQPARVVAQAWSSDTQLLQAKLLGDHGKPGMAKGSEQVAGYSAAAAPARAMCAGYVCVGVPLIRVM